MEQLENIPKTVHFDRHELGELYDEHYHEYEDTEDAKDYMLKAIGSFAIEHYKVSKQPVYVKWSSYDQGTRIGRIVSYHSEVVVFLMDVADSSVRAYWDWAKSAEFYNFLSYQLGVNKYAVGYDSMGDYSDHIEEVFTLGAPCNAFHKRILERYDA